MNSVPARFGFVLVDIYANQSDLIALIGNLSERWLNHFAGSAPGRPKVNDNDAGLIDYFTFKILITNLFH